MTLLPCPFCSAELERSNTLSTRNTDYFIHPINDKRHCTAKGICIPVASSISSRAATKDEQDRAEAWNTRAYPAISDDLRERIQEVKAWHSTGVLPGASLRDLASSIQEKHGRAFDKSQALSMAEEATKRECMDLVLQFPTKQRTDDER